MGSLSRRGITSVLIGATWTLGGCALNYPRPVICNPSTGRPMTPAELEKTPTRRWSKECANAIAEVYWPPRHAKGLSGSVAVETIFDRKGKPVTATITASSGSDILDGHARKTVLRAVCPPFPKTITHDELTVHSVFRYGRSEVEPCGGRSAESTTP
jgi:TonB family protein